MKHTGMRFEPSMVWRNSFSAVFLSQETEHLVCAWKILVWNLEGSCKIHVKYFPSIAKHHRHDMNISVSTTDLCI